MVTSSEHPSTHPCSSAVSGWIGLYSVGILNLAPQQLGLSRTGIGCPSPTPLEDYYSVNTTGSEISHGPKDRFTILLYE